METDGRPTKDWHLTLMFFCIGLGLILIAAGAFLPVLGIIMRIIAIVGGIGGIWKALDIATE